MRVKGSVLERLEDFRAWGRAGAAPGGAPITLLDYVGFVARPDSVFAFAELFFPELVEHAGRKYLASRFSSAAYDAWIEAGRSAEETQRLMNHLHVCWLIQNQPIDDETALEIASAIASVWTRTLGPEGLTVEAEGTTFDDAAVTFFDQRPRAGVGSQ
jgi:hypothetical protein